MVRKLTTLAVVALALVGMTVLNMYWEPQRITAAQDEAAREAAEKLAQAKQAQQQAAATAEGQAEEAAGDGEAVLEDMADWPEKTPDSFRVAFETTMGTFEVECNRAWSPNGADRFYELVRKGYYDGNRFFRVVKEPRPFVVQFGINGSPEVSKKWVNKMIKDDPVMQSNTEGYVTFAKSSQPNSRTTQIFINLTNNSSLDRDGFAPFAKVVKGLEVVKSLNGQYGERPTQTQSQIHRYGNEFLDQQFPGLDYVRKARLVK